MASQLIFVVETPFRETTASSTQSRGAVLPSLFLPRPLSCSPGHECRGNLLVSLSAFLPRPNCSASRWRLSMLRKLSEKTEVDLCLLLFRKIFSFARYIGQSSKCQSGSKIWKMDWQCPELSFYDCLQCVSACFYCWTCLGRTSILKGTLRCLQGVQSTSGEGCMSKTCDLVSAHAAETNLIASGEARVACRPQPATDGCKILLFSTMLRT